MPGNCVTADYLFEVLASIGLVALFNKFPRYYEEKLHGIFPAKFITWELKIKLLDESAVGCAA